MNQMTSTNSETGEPRLENILQAHVEMLTGEFDNRIGKGTFAHDDELATWYLGKLSEIEAAQANIKHQAEVLINQLDARRKALAFRWGHQFKEIVDKKMHSQGGKKKSVDFLTGRSGYRNTPAKFTVVDMNALVEWCEFNCPEAIRRSAITTPVKKLIEQTGEAVPGIKYTPARESFYPPITTHELEPAHTHPQLEQGD